MSQGQDWNTPGAQSYPQQPPTGQGYGPAAVVPADGYGRPGMAPAVPIPPGFYYDQRTGYLLPEGTVPASVGRRIGAYFLGLLLYIGTLGIGFIIWGLIAWSKGQTPAQQCLGLRTWQPHEMARASWGKMFLRELCWVVCGIPVLALVSLWLFVGWQKHLTLHDVFASTVVLHDPNKVLQ